MNCTHEFSVLDADAYADVVSTAASGIPSLKPERARRDVRGSRRVNIGHRRTTEGVGRREKVDSEKDIPRLEPRKLRLDHTSDMSTIFPAYCVVAMFACQWSWAIPSVAEAVSYAWGRASPCACEEALRLVRMMRTRNGEPGTHRSTTSHVGSGG